MNKFLSFLTFLCLNFLTVDLMSQPVLPCTPYLEKPYGVCTHITRPKWDYEIRDKELSLTEEVGINWVRSDLDSYNMFSSHTQYDPTVFSNVLSSVKNHNQELLAILTWLGKYPWDDPEYTTLVKTLAQTFDGKITHWEHINEVNLFKKVDNLCPKYVQSLKETYKTLKSVNPNNMVLTSGFAELPDEFISEFSKSEAKNYFDIFNFHSYQVPENMIPYYSKLAEYMNKDGWSKPVWVTECGMHTAKSEINSAGFYTDLLPEALSMIGIRENKIKIGVLSDNETNYHALTDDEIDEFILPNVKSYECVSFKQLHKLNVKRIPVLIATRSEYFPKEHFEDLVEYVRNGGTIVLSGGMPFYYDAYTADQEYLNRKTLGTSLYKELHMSPLRNWNDPSTNTKITETPPVSKRANNTKFSYEWKPNEKSPARYLDDSNLSNGDELIPLITAGSENYQVPIAGIYKLNSELKGNIIFQTRMYASSVPNREAEQARRVARLYLTAFAYGVNRVFWYNLRSNENDLTYSEDCFGMIHNDFTEKPSLQAYRTLTKMLPDGSRRPVLTEKNGIYHAEWTKPDGKEMHALWSTAIKPVIGISTSKKSRFYDHLGNEMKHPGSKITLSSGVVFIEGNLETFLKD